MTAFVLAVLALLIAGPGLTRAADDPTELLQALFGDELRRAASTRDTADDLELAGKLVAAARSTPKQPAIVETFCDQAYKLAARDNSTEGYDAAVDALETLIELVPDKAAEAGPKIVLTLRKKFTRVSGEDRDETGTRLIELYVQQAEWNEEAGDYEGAGKEYRQAILIARAIKSAELATLEASADAAAARERIERRITLLRHRLTSDPKNDVLLGELVAIYVVDLNKPAAALPFAARGGDETLARRVSLAVKPVADIPLAESLPMGDWYVELAESASEDAAKHAMLTRAAAYLDRYLAEYKTADVSRAKATIVLKRVKTELEKFAASAAPDGGHTNGNSQRNTSKPGKRIDLAKLVKPNRDATDGKWETSGSRIGTLVEGDSQAAWVKLPVHPTSDYEVTFRFNRTAGRAVVKCYLPMPWLGSSYDRGISLTLGADDGKIALLESGAGYSYYYSYYYAARHQNNPTLTRAIRFSNGKTYSIKAVVQQGETTSKVTVYLAGKKYIAWEGDPKSLTGSSSVNIDRNAPALAVFNPVQRSGAVFTNVTMRSLKGEVKVLHEE